MYVYIRTGSEAVTLFTVGFYAPDDEWHPDSDHSTKEEAGDRVAYLNGSVKCQYTKG